ncbi:MAG: hypothetical protein WD534_00340 [Phycisphaeraceae bacterium]
MGSQAASPGPAEGRRCVVWVPPEGAAPTRLLAGLALRQVPAAVVLDAPSVMLQLAGNSPGAVVALIVVEPEDQPHLHELLAAVRTYHPGLAMWQYRAEGGGLTRLSLEPETEAEPIQAGDSADTVDEQSLAHVGPRTGSRPHSPSPAATSVYADDRPAHRRLNEADRTPLISPEELDMLLGPIESLEPEPPRP